MTARSSIVSASRLISDCAFEPVGEFVGACCPDEPRKLSRRGVGHGNAGEHHAGEHKAAPRGTGIDPIASYLVKRAAGMLQEIRRSR